jgi:hypothetical protein
MGRRGHDEEPALRPAIEFALRSSSAKEEFFSAMTIFNVVIAGFVRPEFCSDCEYHR